VRERNLPITFVVLDNGGYGSTRFFEEAYVARLGDKASPPHPSYSGSDMRGTGSSVEGVLEGFGIPTQVFSSAQEARAGIERAWAESGQGPNAIIIRMEF
jgi:thiamine pyrophosphate-dependent acetolactate synthase large subunit-like protein